MSGPSSDVPPETRATLGMVLLLGALTAFTPFSIDLYLPGLPSMATELRATASQAEMTVAAFFIGISVGQLFYGPLSDRVGRRGPLLAGIFVYTAASIACAAAPTIGWLIAFRLVEALGGCAGVVLARAIVRDRFPPQQTAQVFSTLMLVMGLAPVLAPLAGSFLITVSSWRMTFWLLTAFGAACGFATLFRLPESRPDHVAEHARSESAIAAYMALLRQPRLIGYVLYGSCSSAALLTYVTTAPEIMMGIYHVRVGDFGWVFGINSCGLIAASQINGRLLRYHRYETILPWANLGAILSSVLLVAQAMTGFGGLVGLMIPLFLVMSSFGFNAANAMAGAMSVDPRRGGSTAGLMGAAQFAAGAAGAGLAGAFHDGTARPTAWVVLGSVVVAALALHGLARRPDRTAA